MSLCFKGALPHKEGLDVALQPPQQKLRVTLGNSQ